MNDDTNPVVQTEATEQQPEPTANEIAQVTPQSPDQEAWDRLSGKTHERFRTILSENRELRNRIAEIEQTLPPPPPAPMTQEAQQPGKPTDEQRAVINKLGNLGLATKEDVEEERERLLGELQKMQDNMVLDSEYTRLEQSYDGSDGRPVFDREEVEDYMKRNSVYNPETAYNDLYREELIDWEVRRRSGSTMPNASTPDVYTERPSGTTAGQTEPLSVQSLRERLAQPDGREWWEKNRERILPQLGSLMEV